MKVLVLGATGMAGHTIALYFKKKKHEVQTLTRKPFNHCKNIIGNITDPDVVKKIISEENFDAVINCIGILNHDAERNKPQAILINSYLPHLLSDLTKDLKTQIIQMSTDCVFSGKVGQYKEYYLKDGETFYDRTKALGEINNSKDLTFRNSIIGPDMDKKGIGLFNWFMKQQNEIVGYKKVMWTGVTTLTLAQAMEQAVIDHLTGIYHLVNNHSINKYDLLQLFNQTMERGLTIHPDESFILDKSLVNTRKDFSFKVPSYGQMIEEMKEWIMIHKELYPHYFN